MDYTRIYHQIVERAKTRVLQGYHEKHHIVPKALGGTDDANNLVCLTPKEHFVCHLCLVRMSTGVAKARMSLAAKRLIDSRNPAYAHVRITGRLYASLRETIAAETRVRMSAVNKGVPKSAEWKRQMSERMKGNSHAKGTKHTPRSEKTRELLSQRAKERAANGRHPMAGRSHSKETREKISQAKRGKKMKPEHVEAMRQRMTGKKRGVYRDVHVTCHPERPHLAKGLCSACYWKTWRKKKTAVESE